MSVCSRLKRPADERREAARLVLQLPQPLQVLDPLGQRFDVAEHHGGRAAAAEFVPDAMHFEPFVGQHFAASDRLADAIDENLGAAAGQAAQAGSPSAARSTVRSGSLLTLVK